MIFQKSGILKLSIPLYDIFSFGCSGPVHQKSTDILPIQMLLVSLNKGYDPSVQRQGTQGLVNGGEDLIRTTFHQGFASCLLLQQHLSKLRWSGIW